MAKTAGRKTSGSMAAADRVFSGVFPTGISYADRTVEVGGDYKRLAFLPFSTLILEWSAKRVPADVRAYIVDDAARIQARRGQDYQVSSAGQTVRLGGGGDGSAETKKTTAQLKREINAALAEDGGDQRFRVDVENQPRRIFNSAEEALNHGMRRVFLPHIQTSEMLERLKRGEPAVWSYGFSSVEIAPL